MKVDKIIGSLQTFEVSINGRSEKKNNGVAFVSNTQEKKDQDDKDIEESFSDAIAYLGRKFIKSLNRLNKKRRIKMKTFVPSSRANKKTILKENDQNVLNIKALVTSKLNILLF